MISLTATIDKEIIKKGRKFIASLLLLDLCTIFKRDGTEREFNALTYIWCNNDNTITHLGGDLYIQGTPIYIGFSSLGKFEDIQTHRPFNHDNDLLDFTLEDKFRCYCVCGLSTKEAHYLEAHWIDALNLPLTKHGCYEHIHGTLINKKRERKPNIKTYSENEWR